MGSQLRESQSSSASAKIGASAPVSMTGAAAYQVECQQMPAVGAEFFVERSAWRERPAAWSRPRKRDYLESATSRAGARLSTALVGRMIFQLFGLGPPTVLAPIT